MRNTLEWYNNHQNELNWVCNRFFQHWYAHSQYQFFWISTVKREWDLAEKEINHCKTYHHTLYNVHTYIHSLILDLLQHLVGHLLLFYFCWSVMIVHQQEFPFKLRLEQTVFSDIPSRNDYGRVVHVVIAHTCFVMIDRVILSNTRNARKNHISLWKYHFWNRSQTCLQIIDFNFHVGGM